MQFQIIWEQSKGDNEKRNLSDLLCSFYHILDKRRSIYAGNLDARMLRKKYAEYLVCKALTYLHHIGKIQNFVH